MANKIEENLKHLDKNISSLNLKSSDPIVVAVSKKQSIEKIKALVDLGHLHFGENYLQEAEDKIDALSGKGLQWHFIGGLQSKKIPKIVKLFSWIHSVDSLISAEKISKVATNLGVQPNILLQVNIANEETKRGIGLGDLNSIIEKVLKLPDLKLRGLMIFPPIVEDKASHWLREGGALFNDCQKKWGMSLDVLSMGTSGDYQEALLAGSSLIRVGQTIFGART